MPGWGASMRGEGSRIRSSSVWCVVWGSQSLLNRISKNTRDSFSRSILEFAIKTAEMWIITQLLQTRLFLTTSSLDLEVTEEFDEKSKGFHSEPSFIYTIEIESIYLSYRNSGQKPFALPAETHPPEISRSTCIYIWQRRWRSNSIWLLHHWWCRW